MILWLASYPRSGNTLLRMILRQCFDVWSYGAVDTEDDPELGIIAGHLSYPGDRSTFLRAQRRAPGTHFIKTHLDVPEDGDWAIYVVRDGRAALASYQRFLRDFDNVQFTLEQLAVGWPLGMTWADHVARWIDRDNVLLLRYEHLATLAGTTLQAVSRFIDRPILRPFELTFADVHAMRPTFFGVGSDAPGIELVEREAGDVFWAANGAMMERLGYGPRSAVRSES